jgi:transcriptional regulator with GAF, ATPase, and Fis domain
MNLERVVGDSAGGAVAVERCFVGCSTAFESIKETLDTVAPRKSSVIICGETGTGKEMVARQIHELSPRRNKPFVPVDCTALSGQIFESQLFGHVKGAFTGALNDTLGFFRVADGGTLFLDEIGELDLELQAKLLRVLQESCVVPVGSTKPHPIDVRVICATNRDLKEMVRQNKFRLDLYFRLNVVKIEVPPLRERQGDVQILAEHFIEKQANLYGEEIKTLSVETRNILLDYNWPGNVRELANIIEHAYISSKTTEIHSSALPDDILSGDELFDTDKTVFMSFAELKKKLVVRALKTTNGKKMAAAKLLEIDHRKLARLVDEFDIIPTWK